MTDEGGGRERRGVGSVRRTPPRTRAGGRLEALLDPGSFVELDAFANGGDVVTGVGAISGRDVAVYALEESLGEVGAAKVVKVQELAVRNRIPIIGLDGSGGARVGEGVAALAGWADVLYRNVRSSGVVPQLSVRCRPDGGQRPWSPALTDFVFAVAGGDASSTAHFLAEDEARCWGDVRRLLSYLPAHSGETPPFAPTDDPAGRADPELQALVPEGPTLPYDVREVITRLLDDRQFLEVQAHVAGNIVVGFGRLAGHSAGVVANQPLVLSGALDAGAAAKAARFVGFCDAFNVPLVSLVDVPGILPGAAGERDVTVRHVAGLLYAYAEATVPKLAVVTRKDYGAAYCVMSPRQLGGDLCLAWPSAEISVLGPEEAADIYVAAERGYIDDVIEPRQTRPALIRGLELCLRKTVERPARKHGSIPL